METKPKILVGTPTLNPDPRFLSCLPKFLFDISKKYEVIQKFVVGKPLYEAEEELANFAIFTGCDFLLFIEDDHYDFTLEMLDSLILANKPVIAIPYFARHFPFQSTCLNLKETLKGYGIDGLNLFDGTGHDSGIHEADLTGFGFTLINIEILKKLSRPLFFPTRYVSKATDQWFYRKLKLELGIKPFANFDYVIPHRELTKENIKEKRASYLDNHSMMARNIMYNKHDNPYIRRMLKRKENKRFEVCL